MLDDITLYWLTNTATSSARLYWENNANNFNAVDISIPAAVTVFPGEITVRQKAGRSVAITTSSISTRLTRAVASAWEQPELFATELRAAFRSLR